LLDQIHNTLEQRLADSFPDNPAQGRACQDWLIPYFARLLDVRLVSPHVAGQRDEVANAIAWRQRKGTQACVEEIGEAITQQELEIQEGWQRVAVTPRVGMPLLPLTGYGIDKTIDVKQAMQVFRHPGLPASTVDFRCVSRAVQTDNASTASKITTFAGVPYQWMQANPHGVPAFPSTYDDVSRRTVDFRTPGWRDGHIHPRRVIASKPVPMGLFTRATQILDWNDIRTSDLIIFSYDEQEKHLYISNRSDIPIVIETDVTLHFADLDVDIFTVEAIRFSGTLTLNDGKLRLRNVLASHVVVNTEYALQDAPALDARDSLFGDVQIPAGSVFMDSCTVLQTAVSPVLTADNCIFNNAVTDNNGDAPANGRIRCSRIPADLAANVENDNSLLVIEEESCTSLVPVFFDSDYGSNNSLPVTPDSAVLTPNTAAEICFGAEDGAELGVYHNGRSDGVVNIQLAQSINLQQDRHYILRDLVFETSLTVEAGSLAPLYLEETAILQLSVSTSAISDADGRPVPVLSAVNSVLVDVDVDDGHARFEYCTVTGELRYQNLWASDCIFSDTITGSGAGGIPAAEDCIRYSRIPAAFKALPDIEFPSCTAEQAIFFHIDFTQALAGTAGFGVLHPATPASVAFGAEDGGEMGAYHNKRYTLQDEALLDKLKNYLPVGIQAVFRPDRNLNQPPYPDSA
jgi:hypothetical protein